MSVQFVIGSSGSGKSYYLYDYMIRESMAHPGKNYFYIVPEQFTMSTQRAFVSMHPDHAIMNIDVLSFPRMAYRVFTELGVENLSVLDDTAKNLILHCIVEKNPEKFPVLGKKMKRPGYIDQMKSLISELMQYHISCEELLEMGETEGMPPIFPAKTKEVAFLYQEFLDFIRDSHITSEQVLEILANVIGESEIVKDAVFVFDGFTGFTPLQNDVIEQLMPLSDRMLFSVIMDSKEPFGYSLENEHELFAMSKKYMHKVLKLAQNCVVDVEDPILIEYKESSRFSPESAFGFLEKNIFRQTDAVFSKELSDSLSVLRLDTPRGELSYCAKEIRRLVQNEGFRYSEIAIVCSDLNTYRHYIPEIFPKYEIPVFTDASVELSYQPAIEFLLSFLDMMDRDFSYESVMHFMGTGILDISLDDKDLFDSYLYRSGVRGYKKYSHIFTVRPKEFTDEELLRINEIRDYLYQSLKNVRDIFSSDASVAEKSKALIALFEIFSVKEKMEKKSEEWILKGDEVKGQEYAQIYDIILALLDKLSDILAEEKVSAKEYSDLLRAGFSASKLGVIPPLMDAVVFGDLERSRLEHIKVLFLVGAVDGLIPKVSNSAGIFSQNERNLLKEADYELAPTERERSFMQKFYLYQILTKASKKLIVTYSRLDREGAAARKSYLISELMEIFSALSIRVIRPEDLRIEDVQTFDESKQALILLCHELRVRGSLDEDKTRQLAGLLSYFKQTDEKALEDILNGVFFRFENDAISKTVANAINGNELHVSVSKLEQYAKCAYQYFLQYGLRLKERREHAFEAYDIGDIYHQALNRFSQKLTEKEDGWKNVSDDKVSAYIKEAVSETYAAIEKTEVYEAAREVYILHRLEETLKRTVWAILNQVRRGKYEPKHFEVELSEISNLASLTYELSDDSKLHLKGRVDRIDTFEEEDSVYVKIIDYKSGKKELDYLSLYYGLQVQLVFYMGASVEGMQNSYPDKKVLPGAMLYYHIDNPFVDELGNDALVENAMKMALRPTGAINESDESIAAIDTDFYDGKTDESDAAHLKKNKNGSYAAASQIVPESQFDILNAFVKKKVIETGENIVSGKIDVSPYKDKDSTGCSYCPYHSICGFELGLDGYDYRKFDPMIDKKNVLSKIEEFVKEKTDA